MPDLYNFRPELTLTPITIYIYCPILYVVNGAKFEKFEVCSLTTFAKSQFGKTDFAES